LPVAAQGAARARLALVTGASRGIGKACAVHLARAGFDVALFARTLREGEERERSSTLRRSDTRPLPGSLDATAELVRAAGREAIVLRGDLLDRASVAAAAATLLERRGGVDVLVNNGRYVGPGHMDRFLETPLELLDRHLEANVMAPLALAKLLLPAMIARGDGLVANVTSDVAWVDPPAPAGAGGWGLGYAISKGALHRVAGVLARELAGTGVRCVNVQPGFVATERVAIDMGQYGFDASAGAPPDAVGAAVAWLASDPRGREWDGRTFPAQEVCRELGLLPGWPPAAG
jgi:NAD(P)-dependent dehydrogenase (short-subunit alcohol dehydrogenase family)